MPVAAAQEAPPQRAGLVVLHGDGQVFTACVSFAEETISSADLLQRAGPPVVLTAYGGLGYGVCAIDGEGCPSGQDCFCQCRGSPCAYWTYSHRQPDRSWAISGVGASDWLLRDGDVDGWAWGDGTVAPPTLSFEDVCPPADASSAAPVVHPTLSPAAAAAEPASQPVNYALFVVFVVLLVGALVVVVVRRR